MSKIDVQKWLKKLKKFPPSDKSSFPYWFNHWIAYNLVAIEWKVWKFKYLFHDIEKPFLKLILPYEKVRAYHRKYHKHHLGYRKPNKIDWMALIIDNQCGMYTKEDSPLSAKEYLLKLIENNHPLSERIKNEGLTLIDKLGIF